MSQSGVWVCWFTQGRGECLWSVEKCLKLSKLITIIQHRLPSGWHHSTLVTPPVLSDDLFPAWWPSERCHDVGVLTHSVLLMRWLVWLAWLQILLRHESNYNNERLLVIGTSIGNNQLSLVSDHQLYYEQHTTHPKGQYTGYLVRVLLNQFLNT